MIYARSVITILESLDKLEAVTEFIKHRGGVILGLTFRTIKAWQSFTR